MTVKATYGEMVDEGLIKPTDFKLASSRVNLAFQGYRTFVDNNGSLRWQNITLFRKGKYLYIC